MARILTWMNSIRHLSRKSFVCKTDSKYNWSQVLFNVLRGQTLGTGEISDTFKVSGTNLSLNDSL